MLAVDKARWRMPIAFPPNLPALGTPAQYAAEQLGLASGGNMQLRVYEPGKLVPAFDILAAVSDGKTEAGYTWIGYDQARSLLCRCSPLCPLGSSPGLSWPGTTKAAATICCRRSMPTKVFKVHAELCGIIGPETAGWHEGSLESLKDYEG